MTALVKNQPVQWRRIAIKDHYLYMPDFDGWVAIINHLKKKVPKYLADRFDCENFAGWFRHECARLWQINSLAELEGYFKGNRHGWGFFTDGEDCFQLESQTGEIIDIEDNFYIPDEIVMG